jgi:hypothetical protein
LGSFVHNVQDGGGGRNIRPDRAEGTTRNYVAAAVVVYEIMLHTTRIVGLCMGRHFEQLHACLPR